MLSVVDECAQGAAEEEEADPLDAFMAEINAEVREDKPAAAKLGADLALDDDDNVADFLEVAPLHSATWHVRF